MVRTDISVLNGQKVVSIDFFEDEEGYLITTKSGVKVRIYHEQD